MVLVQKWPFFPPFFLGNIGQENVFYDIGEGKKPFPGYKSKIFKKLKNWYFSKGLNPWFWSKNGHFSDFFCLGNIRHENVFYDIVEGKNGFLGNKNKTLGQSKNWDCSRGVNPWFCSKNDNFFILFVGNIDQENVFYGILEQKNAFLGYKNKRFKKSKNWHFCKGVNTWYWSKNDHFSNFSFVGNIGQENVFYDIVGQKKSLSRL